MKGVTKTLCALALLTWGWVSAAEPATETKPEQFRLLLALSTQGGNLRLGQAAPVHNVPAGAPPGAGLIGMFVSSMIARSSNERERTAAMQRQTLMEGATKTLLTDLLTAFEKQIASGGMPRMAIEIPEDPSDADQPGLLMRIKEPRIVTMDTWCRFNEDLTQLNVEARLRLWQLGGVQPEKELPLTFSSQALTGSKEELVTRWMDADGLLLRNAVRDGAMELARKLGLEFAPRTNQGATLAEVPVATTADRQKNGAP